jgi:hypothetical protein
MSQGALMCPMEEETERDLLAKKKQARKRKAALR